MDPATHRPVVLLIALGLIVAEFAWRILARGRGYDLTEAAASLGVAAGDIAARAVTAGAVGVVFAGLYQMTPLRVDVSSLWAWGAAFVAVEFFYYWFHRLSHTVRWLWATHAVHHTAHQLVLPSALRLGWTGLISGGWLMFAPLVLLGFHPAMIGALLAANLTYQFVLHTEAVGTLGPLEWVLNTPAHHRVHHASNVDCLDKNFGGVVIVFDRLFGTFAKADNHAALHYGLVHDLASRNPVVIAFHEWGRMMSDMRRAGSWRAAFQVAAGRPR